MVQSCHGREDRLREAAERKASLGRYNQIYEKPPLCNGAVGWSGLYQRANPLTPASNRLDMTAVWSLWMRPLARANWVRTLKLMALSVEVASPQFADTVLVTDRLGKELLVDQLGLRFSEVVSDLDDRLSGVPPEWWVAGKATAYKMMAARKRPFLHIDNDLFWWRVPSGLEDRALIAQNYEYVDDTCSVYDIKRLGSYAEKHHFALPEAWDWAVKEFGPYQRALNCGVFGGTDYAFIETFANEMLRIMTTPPFSGFYSQHERQHGDACVIEQWLLDAMSCRDGIDVFVLFGCFEDAHVVTVSDITHLLGPYSKDDPDNLRAVDTILRRDFPDRWKRLTETIAHLSNGGVDIDAPR